MEVKSYQCPQCGSIIESNNSLCSMCGATYQIKGGRPEQTGQACFSCGHQSDSPGNSCPNCRQTYLVECPECGYEYQLGKKRCPSCGHDNSVEYFDKAMAKRRAERKLLGIQPKWVMIRILIILSVFSGLWFVFDSLEWQGPHALGAYFLLLLVLSLATIYVLYSPSFGITGRTKKRKPKKGTGQLALVFKTLDLPQAEHLKALLESEGVPAFIYNQHATTLDPFDIFSGIRVMVPRVKLAEVRSMMEAFGFDTEDVEPD